MSRYIDADAVKEAWKKIEVNGATLSVIYGLFKSVDDAPHIDIVRCKECDNYAGDGMYCAWNMLAYDMGFCSYGERKE